MAKNRIHRCYLWLVKAVAEHNSNKCLIWPFHVDKDGYGRVRPPVEEFGRITFGAHRLAFKLKYGRWPEPLGTHSCDTPRCCNPRHIKEGTHSTNQGEKAARGRSLRGVQQHDAKLNDDLVRKIRVEYKPYKFGFHRLATKYGITKPIIKGIIDGRLWRHVQ